MVKFVALVLLTANPPAVFASVLAVDFFPAPPTGKPVAMIVAVKVNDLKPTSGEQAYFLGEQIWLSASLLNKLGLQLPAVVAADLNENPQRYVDASRLPHISQSFNPQQGVVSLQAATNAYQNKVLSAGRQKTRQPDPNLNSVYLNYRATTNISDSRETTNVILEPTITLADSVINTSFLASDISQDRDFTRLESYWTKEYIESRRRLTIGDAFTSPAAGSGFGAAVRFAGVQWGTRFEIDPSFVSYPLPTIFGQAAENSTVDLYVNESLRYRTQAEAGPFSIQDPPISNGAGEIQVVVTDLTGRRQVVTTPFYVSTRLLATGLSDYQFNAGALRENFATRSNDYGDKFVSGRYRRGLSDQVTMQGIGEWSSSHKMLAVTGVTALPRLGVVSASYAISDSTVGSDKSYSLAYERQGQRFGLGVRARVNGERFQQLGTNNSTVNIHTDVSASVRFSPWPAANAALIYSDREFHDRTRAKILSMSYSQRIMDRTSLSITASLVRGKDRRAEATGGLTDFDNKTFDITLSRALGGGQVVRLGHNRKREVLPDSRINSNSKISLRKSIPNGLGYGYRLNADYDWQNNVDRYAAAMSWNTRNAWISLDAAKAGSLESASLNIEGSFLFAKNQVFMQRRIRNGFALVDVGGFAGVGVYRDNQLITRTNRNGYAVLPELAPYVENRIRIQADALPITARFTSDRKSAVPRSGGALDMDFEVSREYSALLSLVDQLGEPLPLSTQVQSVSTGKTFSVAYRGQVFITGLDKGLSFSASYQGKTCTFEIIGIDLEGSIINRVGPLECRLQ